MSCTNDEKAACLKATIIVFILLVILTCLFTDPNTPKLSIEEFAVPAFNKTSDEASGDVYFDLKLRNMNKAIGLYVDDPFTVAFSYYPVREPYQKYVWEYAVPAFYQGDGTTKHIRSIVGDHLRPPSSTAVDEGEEIQEVVEGYKHVRRSLLVRSHVEPANNSTAETAVAVAVAAAWVVSFRVEVRLNYRFKLWVDNDRRVLVVGGDVVVDGNSGERVTKGSVELVESAAAAVAAGGPVLVVVVFTSFLLMSM